MKAKSAAKAKPADQPDLFTAGPGKAAPAPANDSKPQPQAKIAVQKPAPKAAEPAKSSKKGEYTAADIEVLEGLEPVRRRPGMYIGGTDERALHHLAAEILDNAMDEAVAGHASRIEVEFKAGNRLT